MTPTSDDFSLWRDHPVTQWVFAALAEMSEMQKQHWMTTSWEQGACVPEMLAELRLRADTLNAISDTPYERFCEVLGTDPKE